MGIKIPEHRQRVSPPGPSGYRERAVTILPEAIGKAGQVLVEVGLQFEEQYRKAQLNDQIANANLQLKEGVNTFLLGLATDPEYEKYPEKFQTFKGDLYKNISRGLTDQEAKDLFKASYDLTMADLSYTVEDRSQKLGLAHMEANFDQRIARLIEMGDREGIEQEFTNAVATGLKFKDVAVTEKTKALHDCDYNIAQMGVMQYGIEWLYSKEAPDLPLNEREEIQKWYEAKMKVIEDAFAKEREAEVEAIQEDLVKRFAAFSRGEGTARELIDFVNQTTLDPVGTNSKQWWNDKIMKTIEKPEEEKNRYEITDPEIEAKVINYLRKKDKTPEQKESYILARHGKGLSNDDANKYLGQIGKEKVSKPSIEKDPDELTNPDLFIEITGEILDPNIGKIENKRKIFENLGADEAGNPRLNATDAEKLTSWTNEHKNDPVFKQALNMFTDAFNNGFINETELAEITNDYQIKVSSGDYTPTGLIDEAKNMIGLKNDEYIADDLERRRFPKEGKPGKFEKRKETPEEYVERHPPEKKPPPPIEEGNISDFVQWKNIDVLKRDVMRVSFDIGDVFSDDGGNTWYMKYKGAWYTVDSVTGDMIPYKRER